jgi:hydroxymethylpyrimidine/phosphomethylpyrimidine kinase
MTRHETARLPVALTIAGSDSGGGAGIQADLKTFHAFGVFGTSAITAITVQNTLGVSAVHAVPVDIVRGQIAAVATDLRRPRARRACWRRASWCAVAAAIREHGLRDYVLDPVMVATSGDRLLDEDAEGRSCSELVPLATLVTPNLDEADDPGRLRAVRDVPAMHRAARSLVAGRAARRSSRAVTCTGTSWSTCCSTARDMREFRRPRLHTRSTHGTGCTLSAAVAAALACGAPLVTAVEHALDYVHRAIAQRRRVWARGMVR